jgi:hypothetical protein
MHLYQSVLGLLVCEWLYIDHNRPLILKVHIRQVQFHRLKVLIIVVLRWLWLDLRGRVRAMAFATVELGWQVGQLYFSTDIIVSLISLVTKFRLIIGLCTWEILVFYWAINLWHLQIIFVEYYLDHFSLLLIAFGLRGIKLLKWRWVSWIIKYSGQLKSF